MIETNLEYCRNKHYAKEVYQELERISKKDYRCLDETKVIEVTDGIILPAKEDKNRPLGLGGIINSDGEFVEDSKFQFVWETDTTGFGGAYEIDMTQVEESKEEVLYLGPLKNEWGHFLIDFMQRLWYVAEHPANYKIAYVEVKSFHYGKPLLKNIIEIFSLLGIPEENLISIKQPTRFEKIIVPQMFFGPFGYKDKNKILYQTLREAAEKRCSILSIYEKIYYTRCQLKDHKEIGEELIEKFFENNGYQILAPEKLSASEQIYYMSHCKKFACIEGSAAHNIVFAQSDLQQYIIGKRCRNNLRQPVINQMMGIAPTYISAFATRKRDDGFYGPFLMVINEDVERFAHEHDMRVEKNASVTFRNYCKYYWLSYRQELLEHFQSLKNKISRR